MKTSIVLIASSLASVSAFAGPQSTTTTSTSLSATRRDTLSQFGTTAAAVLLSGVSSAQASDKEEYSELINVLKARSEDNKEANANYAVRANKMSSKDFKDAKSRRPKLIIVETSKGSKIFTKEEFNTLDRDGKIETSYGVRQKQGGGEMKDYNNITYTLLE